MPMIYLRTVLKLIHISVCARHFRHASSASLENSTAIASLMETISLHAKLSVAEHADASVSAEHIKSADKQPSNRYARKKIRRQQLQQQKIDSSFDAETSLLAPSDIKKRPRDDSADDADRTVAGSLDPIPRRGSHYYLDKVPSVCKSIDTAHYFTSNGLLRVRPYSYTWCSFGKTRWQGRQLRSIFEEEFSSPSEHVQRERLKQFRVRVNDQPVTSDYVVQGSEFIQHDIHRHEAPVLERACNIPFVYEDEHVLVVNKPCSIPVHPCGRYFYNTLLGVLARFQNKRDLRITHRLDRATSGIVIFAKTPEVASQLGRQHQDRLWQKEYICRVRGDFPSGTITCEEPIDCADHRNAVYMTRGQGKPSTTIFEKLHTISSPTTGSIESIVLAKPITGRTHQIRVHLLHLGYPITNDPVYGREEFCRTKPNGERIPDEEYIALVSASAAEHHKPHFTLRTEKPANAEEIDFREDCPECWLEFVDPEEESLIMYLHAYRYRYVGKDDEKVCGVGDKRDYATDIPEWARKDQ